jgi:hypothetical protein
VATCQAKRTRHHAPLCVSCRIRPVQNRGPVLFDARPLDALLRDVRAECYRYATEIGPIDTPYHMLMVAAIHEGAQATTALVLESLDQLDLPKSRPVLSGLWEEVREYRRFYRRNYEALKRSFTLACNRVLRPRMVAEEEVVESWRACERLSWEPKPLMTLRVAFFGELELTDADRHTRQVLERCPLLKHLIASQHPSGASQTMMITGLSQALNERCPSAQELWSRILNRHAVDAPEPDDPARYREPLTPSELHRGLCAAFLLGPVLESIEVISMRFEGSAVRLLAEKVDELFAVPLHVALVAPLHAVLPVDASGGVTPESPAPLVILGKPGDEPTVNGVRKTKLTTPRYNVVKALLAAGDGGLSKDSLANESGHGDAHRVLKRLADSDPDWALVIQMAGKTGCRYRIRRNLPTSPAISRKAPTKRHKG